MSSSSSSAGASRTTRPSRMTSTRSARPSTSGTSLETSSTPDPARGEGADHLVQLGPGADVDAPGRLVEQQQLGVAEQPAADHHLLLVAAGEGAHRPAYVARAQFERVGDLLRLGAFPAGVGEAEPWRTG